MVSVNYNPAGSMANRQLDNVDRMYNASLEKLSSGKRVVNARDDAASLAVGLRLQLGARSLGALAQNVTQGLSITSIAEGGMTQVQSMLGRMQELASQASSGNLGNTERSYLQSEFSQLKTEIDRVAQSTKFGTNQLLNANYSVNAGAGLGAANGLVDIAFGNLSAPAGGATGGFSYLPNGTGANGTGAGTLGFIVSAGAQTFSLSGSLDPSILNGVTQLATGTSVKLSAAAGTLYNGATPYIVINLNTSFVLNGSYNSNYANASGNITFSNTQTNQTSLSFKVGDGGQAYNNIISYIQGVNNAALGLTNADISTQTGADGAGAAIINALDVVTNARTQIGAVQNRLQIAGENQRVALENITAAVSSYLDVDVAAEMTKLTSQEVLKTIGVSMSSQANQSSQSLLKLFQ
jgi:flagellin